jgi:hypothetical protein
LLARINEFGGTYRLFLVTLFASIEMLMFTIVATTIK